MDWESPYRTRPVARDKVLVARDSIAGVCKYRDQNFSTTNDEKETDVPLIWPASFAPPRLIVLAALSLQSNFFPKPDPRLLILAALSFDSNPRRMIHTSSNMYAPFDCNPCHMIQTILHTWLLGRGPRSGD